MRLMKAQSTSLRNVAGKGIRYGIDGRVVIDTTNTMQIPSGDSGQRPNTPTNGEMRYNSQTNEFEFYADGAYRNVKYKEPLSFGIVKQTFTNADGFITLFGPLDSGDTNPLYTAPANANNILVLIENVFQISDTNYTLTVNPSATGATSGQEVDDGFFNIGSEYIITDVGTTTNWADVGVTGGIAQGTVFTASQAGTTAGAGDGKARLTGTYVEFNGAVPSTPGGGKPVTILHNFDK